MKLLLVEDSPGDARLFAELISELPGRPLRLMTRGCRRWTSAGGWPRPCASTP